jgi:hypothetical protein
MFIEQPAKWLRWLYPKAIWRMDPKEHSVYLTFDDGPIPESTPFILETLRKYNIKATFFKGFRELKVTKEKKEKRAMLLSMLILRQPK